MALGYATYEKFLENLLRRLKASFGEDVILSCAVFGSIARGEGRSNSDIDLLIVHKKVPFNPTKRFVDLLFEIQEEEEEYLNLRERGLKPDPYPVFMTEEDLYERPLILLDILDHGIIIYDEGVLEKRLETLKDRLAQLGSKKVVLEDGRWYWDLKPDWKPGEVIEL